MSDAQREPEERAANESSPSTGSIRLGPLVISAKFSIVLIYVMIIGFNVLLMLLVLLAALHRAGRL